MQCGPVSVCVRAQSCSTHGSPGAKLLCSWNFTGKNTGVGFHFLLQGDLPDPGIEPMSPALAGRFFTTEPHLGNGPIRQMNVVVI